MNSAMQDTYHQMLDKLLDIGKNATTLGNSLDNGGKVIVRQDNIGSLLRDVGARLTHSNTDIGSFK